MNKAFYFLLGFFIIACNPGQPSLAQGDITITQEQFLNSLSGTYTSTLKGSPYTVTIQSFDDPNKPKDVAAITVRHNFENSKIGEVYSFTQQELFQETITTNFEKNFRFKTGNDYIMVNDEEFFPGYIYFKRQGLGFTLNKVVLWKTGFALPLLKTKHTIKNFRKTSN